jgi:class 3 adenylate cyclase
MRRQAAALAASDGTVTALRQFTDAYQQLGGVDIAALEEADAIVDDFYRDRFTPALEQTLGVAVGWRSLVPVNDAAVYLQRHYVAAEEEVGEGLVDDAGDGSDWSEVHRELHLSLLEITIRLGAADLYLVDAASGNIVYSVAKEIDFATSLDVGPHGGSTLAVAIRAAREAAGAGTTQVVDMAAYVPNLGSPMMFIASPIFDGDSMAGVLVLKIPSESIDTIVTSNQGWADEGFGDTGEVYLVGEDGRMRSVARQFVEDRDAFLTDVDVAGAASATEQAAMSGVGTTAIFLKVADRSDLVAAVESDSATTAGLNYLLRPVLSSVDSFEVDGFTWFVVTEIEDEEVTSPIRDFRRALLVAVAVFVIGITFATVAWARAVFRPVRMISERLRRAAADEEPVEADVSLAGAPTDFTDLAHNIDEMLAALDRRQADLESAARERLDTVRSLLPPAIVERVESGDREVIDRIPQAGIVVLVTEGLGELVQAQQIGDTQQLLDQLISELDAAAVHHGLERVKLIGDAYYAGCGLNQPYLDHVPRSVAFALDARDIVGELNAVHGAQLQVAAGIHSGPVTVGLTGSMRLVYDLWGETVRVAHFLARRAQAGEILVSNVVLDLLPSDIAVAERPASDDATSVFAVIGQQVPGEVPQ